MAYCERTDDEITDALKRWAECHFAPDEWCVEIAGRRFTPIQFYESVKSGDGNTYFVVGFLRSSGIKHDMDPVEIIEKTIANNATLPNGF